MSEIENFKKNMSDNNNVVWNKNSNLEFLWTFDINADVDTVWNYISDTSRFNREMGLAPRTEKEVDGKNVVTTTMIGFEQQWIEEPWMWLHGQTITSERKYIKGIAYTVQSVFNLQPVNSEKTKISIYFGWQPKNFFWRKFLTLTESMLKANFAKVFKKIEEYVANNKNVIGVKAYNKLNHKITAEQKDRLATLKKQLLEKSNVDIKLIDQLTEYILTGDELDLDAIKVIRLANEWSVDYKELLKVCLLGSKLGLLNLSWTLVCPHCRGSRYAAKNLGEVPPKAECEPCGVEFSTSDPNAVEIIFKIHPSVREIPDVSYCAAEPAKKSHIQIQQTVKPRSDFNIKVPVLKNNYRLRVKGHETNFLFTVNHDAEKKDLKVDLNSKNESSLLLGPQSVLSFTNNSDENVILTIEQLKVADYALRPQHVLMFPEFKDLFSHEHLNSDVKLHLGEQALLFTDIVGSTAYYEKVGDAKAFDEVRKHFLEVFEIIKKNNGEVVKTIGDAVMAAFPTIESALKASELIQNSFNGKRSDTPIRLRISIHKGVVIAVHLETGIDYFGSAINKCAKIQGLAGGGQLAMVDDVYESLKTNLQSYPVESKSYDSDKVGSIPVKVITIS
jgi:class 3 adenylate cyclase